MSESIKQTLINLGMSGNEAIVYLASLETGLAAAQDIAAKADLKRTTTYSVLDALVERRFVLKTQKEGKNKYLAEHPEKVFELFQRYQADFKDKLSELSALYNEQEVKPRVLFYEGAAGIKQIYYDTLEEKPEVILEWNTASIFDLLKDFPEDYVRMRKQRDIHAKRIGPDTEVYREHKKIDKEELSTTKLLPADEYNIPVEINIYNNKVAFMSYGDKMGLIIESKVIADAMRTIYDLFWKNVGKK